MGRGGGKAAVKKLKNWNTINKGSISNVNSNGKIPKKETITTTKTYNKNTSADLKRSGYITYLVNILLMILPLKVWKPILMTIAKD